MPLSNEQWFGSGALGAITGSNTANPAALGGNHAQFTFSGMALGDADASRIIVIAVTVGWNGDIGTVTSVTVGGASNYSTQQVEQSGVSGAENHRAEIWSYVYASGTSADVVVNLSDEVNNNRGCLISVFSLVGAAVLAPGATAKDAGGVDESMTADVDAKKNGYIIAASARQSATSCEWTGATEVSDERKVNFYGSNAYHVPTSDDGTYTIAPTWADEGSSTGCLVLASWHPT